MLRYEQSSRYNLQSHIRLCIHLNRSGTYELYDLPFCISHQAIANTCTDVKRATRYPSTTRSVYMC